MDDDEFMKELLEATNNLETEKINKEKSDQSKQQNNINQNSNNNNSIPPFNEKELNDNLNQLLKMFGNLSPEKMGFDESDKDQFKKFHEAFMNELKSEDLLKEMGMEQTGDLKQNNDFNLNKQSKDNFKNSNNILQDSKENPFTETFNQMNSDLGKDLNLNMFGDEFGKILESLNKLSNFDDVKDSNKSNVEADKIPNFLEGAIESLISAHLLEGPLNEIKNEIIKFKSEKKDISEKKSKDYDVMLENIDMVLKELQQPKPETSKIIDLFSKLQETSELDEELFNKINPDMSFLSGLGTKTKDKSSQS
jgi:hypothetical protein